MLHNNPHRSSILILFILFLHGCAYVQVLKAYDGPELARSKLASIDNYTECNYCIEWIKQGEHFYYMGTGVYSGHHTFKVGNLGTRLSYGSFDARAISLRPGDYQLAYRSFCVRGPGHGRIDNVTLAQGHTYVVIKRCGYPAEQARTIALWIEDADAGMPMAGDATPLTKTCTKTDLDECAVGVPQPSE